jgi:hypothetical protein
VQTGEGSVKVERSEPEGNLDGFLARLHHSQQKRRQSSRSTEPAIRRICFSLNLCWNVGSCKSWLACLAGGVKRVKSDGSWIGSMTTIERAFRSKTNSEE